MGLETLFGLVSAVSIILGGLIWLVKASTAKEMASLEGRVEVEKSRRESLHEMVLGLVARVNGFEERVYQKLDTIEDLIRGKADK